MRIARPRCTEAQPVECQVSTEPMLTADVTHKAEIAKEDDGREGVLNGRRVRTGVTRSKNRQRAMFRRIAEARRTIGSHCAKFVGRAARARSAAIYIGFRTVLRLVAASSARPARPAAINRRLSLILDAIAAGRTWRTVTAAIDTGFAAILAAVTTALRLCRRCFCRRRFFGRGLVRSRRGNVGHDAVKNEAATNVKGHE